MGLALSRNYTSPCGSDGPEPSPLRENSEEIAVGGGRSQR